MSRSRLAAGPKASAVRLLPISPIAAARSRTLVDMPGISPPQPLNDQGAALLDLARAARGFMPDDEGVLLYDEARRCLEVGPALEIGSWCGKSAIYLGAAARAAGSVVFTLDHHRGSEENQPGWEYHDPSLIDPRSGRIDTLPHFRQTITEAGLEEEVIAIVGRAPTVARYWRTPLALLFIDGGHTDEHVSNDYEGFGRWVMMGASMVIHDVFADPAEGGQPPYRCYRRALDSGDWQQTHSLGSMRILRRIVGNAGDQVS